MKLVYGLGVAATACLFWWWTRDTFESKPLPPGEPRKFDAWEDFEIALAAGIFWPISLPVLLALMLFSAWHSRKGASNNT